jgi:hypothetical protein
MSDETILTIKKLREIKGWSWGEWIWCVHCERCYHIEEVKKTTWGLKCPYDECNGSFVLDGWHWERLKKENKDYPAVPIKGIRYALKK